MGILDDLAMGFGMKARTEDYDARTARTIALNERFGIGPNADVMGRSRALANKDYDVTSGRAGRFLANRGAGPSYNPQIAQGDDRPFLQRMLYASPDSPQSPTPYAIGPMRFQEPIRIPGILGMILSGLFGQQNREIPTVSADGGSMRDRPSGYQPPYSTMPYEIGNSGAGMDYVTPAPSGLKYTGAKDYAGTYQNIDSPLLDFRPGTAGLMESHIPLASDGEAVESNDNGGHGRIFKR